MNHHNYKLFNNYKHFSLEYIRYPINMAFQIFRNDLSNVDCQKELRVVKNRWRLAETKFKRDRIGILHESQIMGAVSKVQEYEYYLMAANDYLRKKEAELLKV